MSLYLDTSALLKLYIDEHESDACESFLTTDGDWVAGDHTLVEVRRNLRRLLGEGEAHLDALAQFTDDWQQMRHVQLDQDLCVVAATIAEQTGARTLDALHLAAARAAETPTMVTYDLRLGAAARELGLAVATPGQALPGGAAGDEPRPQ